MDSEAKKRRQSIKVIASEAIMVLTVVLTVIILALLVSGYWLNADFKVERQGMLQVSSFPTGATVVIDGESSWLQRTNTSKVLSAGEHSITLSKDGYDTWSKTVNVSEGLLYRIHYPRLFVKDRIAEEYFKATDTIFATISPDHDLALLLNNTTKWSLIRLTDDKPEPRVIDASKVFLGVEPATDAVALALSCTILSSDWSQDGSHILFKVSSGDTIEWALLDVKNPTKSINLTREFGGNFSEIQILDNSANNLLAVQNGNLHKIDTSGRSMSTVLVEQIKAFDHFENEIVFVAKNTTPNSDSEASPYYAGSIKVGDDKITHLLDLPSTHRIVISKFYDEKYLTLLSADQVTLYDKNTMESYADYDLSFEPSKIIVGHDGEFIFMNSGSRIATIDMESGKLSEWQTPGETFGWLDNNMIYTVADGNLVVYDYDGFNRRELAHNVSSALPVSITGNKWLYYFSDGKLLREWIIEH